MDNWWISCQVMADKKKNYDDLIIINLYTKYFTRYIFDSRSIKFKCKFGWSISKQFHGYLPLSTSIFWDFQYEKAGSSKILKFLQEFISESKLFCQ